MHLHLARELGYSGREALYEALTAKELLEWEILYGIDPWGEYRADLRNGLLCSLTDACHRSKGSPGKPLEYMPIVQQLTERPQQTEESMKATIETAFAAWGKR